MPECRVQALGSRRCCSQWISGKKFSFYYQIVFFLSLILMNFSNKKNHQFDLKIKLTSVLDRNR